MSLLYDSILLVAWLMVAGFIVFAIFPNLADNPRGYPYLMRAYYLFWISLYFGICWTRGQTLGMKVWRLHYLYPTHSKRYKVLFLRFILGMFLMPIWGLLVAVFRHDKKTLADLICHSQLVRTNKR